MAYVSQVEGSDGAGASVDHLDSAQIDAALHGGVLHYASPQNASQHNASQHNIPLEFNAPLHSVVVPDADLLFNGTYHRAGPDLVITGHDGQHFLVPGYFSSEHPPALMAPNGASLTGDVVSMMAGSPTPNHYAQAQPTTPPDAIGKVEKVVGDVTAMRNGVAVTLHVGDAIFKSDVVQTGAGSSVGISFPDGTAFNLVANTRMALAEYSYDPNSHSNEALFNLVQGTFAFVAGKVAHSGDMKIETPVATMGIRGTTGVVEQQPPGTVSANLGTVAYSFAVVKDFGTDVNGAYTLCYLDPSTGDCNVFTTIGQIDYITTVTPLGAGLAPDVRVEPISNAQFAFEQEILQQLFQTLNPTNQQNNGSNGSSTFPGYVPPSNNPELLPPPLLPIIPINFVPGGPTGGNSTPTLILLPPPPPPTPTTGIVIWIGPSGTWPTTFDWNTGTLPGPVNSVEILTPVTVTLGNSQTINGLELGNGAILDIVPGGSLTLFNSLTGPGTLQLDASGGDPTFWVDGTVTLSGGGTILLSGSPSGDNNILGIANTNAKLVNVDWTIKGAGNIGAGDGHLAFINCGTVNADVAGQTLDIHTGNKVENGDATVAPGASPVMEATDGGILRIEDDVSNLGLITALTAGILQLEDITVTNAAGGAVKIGAESTLDLDNSSVLGGGFDNKGNVFATGTSVLHGDTVTNEGNIYVGAHAALTLEGNTELFNAEGALIKADGSGAKITVEIDADQNANSGTMLAVNGGEIDFSINVEGGSNHGLIEAGAGGTVVFNNNHNGAAATAASGADGGATGGNYGTMEADHGGHLTFNGGLDNFNLVEAVDGGIVDLTRGMKNHAGTVLSTGDGSQITLSNGDVVNDATFTASEGGTITFDATLAGLENDGVIQALAGGTVIIDGFADEGVVDNDGGRIQANGEDAKVELAGADIVDGTVASSDGGIVETISGTSIFQDVTLADGTVVETDADTFLDLEGTTTLADPVTLEGDGTFVLTGDGAQIIGSGEDAGLDNKGTITGVGTIGNGGLTSLALNNEHVIDANVAGGTLAIETGGTDINTGTMEATNGGTLLIKDSVDNRGGTIDAFGEGSLAELAGGITITGGRLATSDRRSSAGGMIEVLAAATAVLLDGTNAHAVTIDGYVKVEPGADLALAGAIHNDGTIDVDVGKVGPGSNLVIDCFVDLDGCGTVVLDGNGDRIVAGTSHAVLDNSSHIVGSGQIGTGDDSLKLINEGCGVIDANGNTAAPLFVDTGCVVICNSGTMQATDGGTLIIESDVDNHCGLIEAIGCDSTVELVGVTITGGTLATSFDGLIEVSCGISTFDDLSIACGSNVLVDEGASLALQGTIDNDGTIALASGFDDPNLIIDGNVNLDGFGTIVLSGADDHVIGGYDGGTLYNDNAIVGSGTIGGHGLQLVNLADGVVDANGNSYAPLVLDTGCFAVDNAGLLESTRGGTLDIKSDVDNACGTIASCGEGSDTKLFGITVTGGALETRDHGTIEVVDSYNASVFDGTGYHPVTVDGYVQVDDGAQLELQGNIDLTSAGIINVDEREDGGQLIIDGTVHLNGCGGVVLSGNDDSIIGGHNGDGEDRGSDVLINGVTISGYGRIGDGHGDLFLTNDGTVDANLNGKTLVIDTDNVVDNRDGTLEASHGGTLQVDDIVKGGDALIAGGTMVFDAKADGVDVTFDNGTGEAKTYGDLVLGDAKDFSGLIYGFAGVDLSRSDEIDLVGIRGGDIHLGESGENAEITINEDDKSTTITLVDFDYHALHETSDEHGGTIIYDPPIASSGGASTTTSAGINLGNDQINLSAPASGQDGSVTTPLVGSSTDNFVFHSALDNAGASTAAQPLDFATPAGNANQPPPMPVVTEAVFDPVHDTADLITAQFHQVISSVTHLQ